MSEHNTHSPASEGGIEPDGLDTPQIVMWGFVSVVTVVAVMFGAAALFNEVQDQLNVERIERPVYVDAEEVVLRHRGLLASYGVTPTEPKQYHIPIDKAKALVLRDLQAGRAAPPE